MSVADDVQELFAQMPAAFVAEKAAGVNATIQLNLSGEGASNWSIIIADGRLEIAEGTAESADMTLSLEASDYIAMTKGEADPMTLFMGGKIKLEGDMGLAMKFQEMFK